MKLSNVSFATFVTVLAGALPTSSAAMLRIPKLLDTTEGTVVTDDREAADRKTHLKDVLVFEIHEAGAEISFQGVDGVLTPKDHRIVQASFVSAYNQVKPFGEKLESDGAVIMSETPGVAGRLSSNGWVWFGHVLYDYGCPLCWEDDDDDRVQQNEKAMVLTTNLESMTAFENAFCAVMRGSGSAALAQVTDCKIVYN